MAKIIVQGAFQALARGSDSEEVGGPPDVQPTASGNLDRLTAPSSRASVILDIDPLPRQLDTLEAALQAAPFKALKGQADIVRQLKDEVVHHSLNSRELDQASIKAMIRAAIEEKIQLIVDVADVLLSVEVEADRVVLFYTEKDLEELCWTLNSWDIEIPTDPTYPNPILTKFRQELPKSD